MDWQVFAESMRNAFYGCLSFFVMLFVVAGAEPKDGPPVPKFMVVSVALIGKGEEAHELQVDNKVAFLGRQIAKAPEHFRARIEESERLVVLYSRVLGEVGLRALESVANIRSDAKKRTDFVDTGEIDADDRLQVVFFSGGTKGGEPRWTIGEKEYGEVDAVIRELVGAKSKKIALVGEVPKDLLEEFGKALAKSQVKMVPSTDKPDLSDPFTDDSVEDDAMADDPFAVDP